MELPLRFRYSFRKNIGMLFLLFFGVVFPFSIEVGWKGFIGVALSIIYYHFHESHYMLVNKDGAYEWAISYIFFKKSICSFKASDIDRLEIKQAPDNNYQILLTLTSGNTLHLTTIAILDQAEKKLTEVQEFLTKEEAHKKRLFPKK